MEPYTGFASVYDLFMEDIPYEQWKVFIVERLEKYGITEGLVLDLGCGTGRMTRLLAQQGYEMIGIDLSAEMLSAAQRKQEMEETEILYSCQSMQEFELYGTVRAVVCCCDCVNYILEEEELAEVFRLVNNYLDPGGIFIFDFNTQYKYEQIGGQTFAENREEGSFIWENYYDEESGINEYDLTLFIKQEERLYEKYEETHLQRAYTLEQMKRLLELAGMEYIDAWSGYTDRVVDQTSERICIAACERGKQRVQPSSPGYMQERETGGMAE